MVMMMMMKNSSGLLLRDQIVSLSEPWLSLSSIFLGILLCKFVYSVMKVLSPGCSKAYCNLPKMQQIEWDNRGFSTVHAFLVTAAGSYLLFISDLYKDDAPYGPVVFRSSFFSQAVLGISNGYFLSDLAMILWFYPALGGKEYVLHHLLSLLSLGLSSYSRAAQFYSMIVLFSELTTPFVNLRWYLSAAGLKKSRIYVINGLLLFLGWLIVRVLLFVYLFAHMFSHYDQVRMVFAPGFYCLLITPQCLFVMNMYWFYKVVRGLVRTLTKRA